MRPTDTQISLHICAVWSVFIIRMKKLYILGCPKCAQRRFGSDCANAQSDPNLRRAHISEGSFSHVAPVLILRTKLCIWKCCLCKLKGIINLWSWSIVYRSFYTLLMCLKRLDGNKQCSLWSDAAFCIFWFRSTPFAQASQSHCLGLLRCAGFDPMLGAVYILFHSGSAILCKSDRN